MVLKILINKKISFGARFFCSLFKNHVWCAKSVAWLRVDRTTRYQQPDEHFPRARGRECLTALSSIHSAWHGAKALEEGAPSRRSGAAEAADAPVAPAAAQAGGTGVAVRRA